MSKHEWGINNFNKVWSILRIIQLTACIINECSVNCNSMLYKCTSEVKGLLVCFDTKIMPCLNWPIGSLYIGLINIPCYVWNDQSDRYISGTMLCLHWPIRSLHIRLAMNHLYTCVHAHLQEVYKSLIFYSGQSNLLKITYIYTCTCTSPGGV